MKLLPHWRLVAGACWSLACVAVVAAQTAPEPSSVWRVMPLGDSITAGNGGFGNYRVHLARLFADLPHRVEFVGTEDTRPPHAGLRHQGHGGRNTEFLATHFEAWFRTHPADIILLHSGHNHTVEEDPVPGILRATEQIVSLARAQNPRVVILLAQVIPAGKLPKYEYLPALNRALAELAPRLHRPEQPVILVDQARGFSVAEDTVADKVHPNERGAEKIARRWLEALQPILASGRTPGNLSPPLRLP
jgi:lysophospholipase L1-like esterase